VLASGVNDCHIVRVPWRTVGTDGVRTSRAGILRDEARACRGVSTSTSKVKLVIEFQRNVVACCIRCQDLTTMKVGAKKLQIKTNTARKKDLNVKGRIIFDALMQRTQLKAVDATSLKGGKESIMKLFSNLGELGIEEGDVSFFQVTANIRLQGVCARGGLSVIEGKSLNKTIVSYKWTLCNSRKKRVQVLDKKKSTGRILKRPSLERKSALVYLDGKGKSKDMPPFT
jgi:hypothetical protein